MWIRHDGGRVRSGLTEPHRALRQRLARRNVRAARLEVHRALRREGRASGRAQGRAATLLGAARYYRVQTRRARAARATCATASKSTRLAR